MTAEPSAHRVMDPATALGHVRDRVAAARAVLAAGDLDAAVPACPGWALRDLAWHLGDLHRWVRGAIVEGHPNTETPQGPHDRGPLLAWYDQGAGDLFDLLARTDPDTPCWTFGPTPKLARFWFRRQAHEHAVHVVDAQASQGPVGDLSAELALDGIDEVAGMFFPRQVRLHRIEPLTRSLAVRPTEAGHHGWLLAGDGTAVATTGAAPEATVTGTAEALYLLLWHRIGLDDARLTVTGDRAAAHAVLGTAIVP
jgi:uncharacterized protein (TIGR03083 family)